MMKLKEAAAGKLRLKLTMTVTVAVMKFAVTDVVATIVVELPASTLAVIGLNLSSEQGRGMNSKSKASKFEVETRYLERILIQFALSDDMTVSRGREKPEESAC